MTKDPFANFKLPIGLTEGVEIPLTGTPAVFHVRLPASMDEDFNMELMSRLSADVDENGEMRVNAAKFQKVRKDMFFETCIISAKGLPKGMSHGEFFETYPLAMRSIYEKATELASKADEEASAALGKSESLPNGKASGGGVIASTKTSSKAASKSKPAALN